MSILSHISFLFFSFVLMSAHVFIAVFKCYFLLLPGFLGVYTIVVVNFYCNCLLEQGRSLQLGIDRLKSYLQKLSISISEDRVVLTGDNELVKSSNYNTEGPCEMLMAILGRSLLAKGLFVVSDDVIS